MNFELRTYIGTKTIKATPMEAEAAKQHGAQITDETVKKNIGNDGYLVEYPDGYRSWSPKKSFDEAYRLAESYLDRLRIEHEDLKCRYLRGQEFVYSSEFNHLSEDGTGGIVRTDGFNAQVSFRSCIENQVCRGAGDENEP